MNPINQVPQDDMHKYVFQEQPIIISPYAQNPKQKFSLEQSKKNKKAEEKEPSPWLPKKRKKEDEPEV
jgi:hypothetical protein